MRGVCILSLNFSFLSESVYFFIDNWKVRGLCFPQFRSAFAYNFQLASFYVLGKFEIIRPITSWIVLHSVLLLLIRFKINPIATWSLGFSSATRCRLVFSLSSHGPCEMRDISSLWLAAAITSVLVLLQPIKMRSEEWCSRTKPITSSMLHLIFYFSFRKMC